MLRCATLLLVFSLTRVVNGADYTLPDRVKVLPVAFVPSDEKPPTADEQKIFLRHVRWAQDRYRELLSGDTFDLAESTVQIVNGRKPLDYYRKSSERGAPDIVAELLSHFQVSRFSCPYVFCILLMNSKDSFPEGGGRSINGGINTGGGMMYIASWELTHNSHFQTTLQHELGHAFGLPHVDVYGYDMNSNASIMSYNKAHHCQGFTPSSTPGELIPEDRRVLALNDRVFAKTTFNPVRDVPVGYQLSRRIVPLGPMSLPGQPDFYPQIMTTAGEDVLSKVAHVVREEIKPSSGPGITYDPGTMWHSKPLSDGKAVLEITFPTPVQLSGIAIHSQHSGIHHEVTAVRVETADGTPRRRVVDKEIKLVDDVVQFAPTQATKWVLTLTAGPSRIIIIRGLRFFDGDSEVCPHLVPYVHGVEAATIGQNSIAAKTTDDVKAEASSTDSREKKPTPDNATLEKQRKSVKERFKVEITKARKPEAKASVARTIVEQSDMADDDVEKFAMLAEAISLAGQSGDLELALQVAKTLSDQFDVKNLEWKERAAAAVGSATLSLELEQASALLAQFVAIANEAVAADEYVVAVNVMKSAAEMLKKPAFKPLRDDANFMVKQLTAQREAFDATTNAREKLVLDPEDPAANLAWGRFVCFYKQDRENGLKLMSKGNDKVWAPIALRELSPPQSANDWLQLGDDWLQAGIREKDPTKTLTCDYADRAWQQAVAAATQLHKKDIEQKVDQRLGKLFGTSFVVTKGDSGGVAIPGSNSLSPTEAFTIEFWVSTTAAKGTLLSKKHSGEDASIIVHLDNSVPNLSVASGGGEGGSGGGAAINDGYWHHLALVKQGNELVLYVDGRRGVSSTLKVPLQSRSPWKFGASHNRVPCAARFGGLRISKSARYTDAFTPAKIHVKDKDTLLPQ